MLDQEIKNDILNNSDNLTHEEVFGHLENETFNMREFLEYLEVEEDNFNIPISLVRDIKKKLNGN